MCSHINPCLKVCSRDGVGQFISFFLPPQSLFLSPCISFLHTLFYFKITFNLYLFLSVCACVLMHVCVCVHMYSCCTTSLAVRGQPGESSCSLYHAGLGDQLRSLGLVAIILLCEPPFCLYLFTCSRCYFCFFLLQCWMQERNMNLRTEGSAVVKSPFCDPQESINNLLHDTLVNLCQGLLLEYFLLLTVQLPNDYTCLFFFLFCFSYFYRSFHSGQPFKYTQNHLS